MCFGKVAENITAVIIFFVVFSAFGRTSNSELSPIGFVRERSFYFHETLNANTKEIPLKCRNTV